MEFDHNFDKVIFKNDKGFKFFSFLKNYGNVCVGMLKFEENQNYDFFEKNGFFFYRVKFEPFEDFREYSMKK